MYEFHGWITIWPTAGIEEIDEVVELEQIRKIDAFIKEISADWGSSLIKLHVVNAQFFIVIAGCTNHKAGEAEDIFKLYEYVGKIASGSYGLLYIRDDEDLHGFNNAFQAYTLIRGKLEKRDDPFFSPCIPVLEDEYKVPEFEA